MGAALRMRPEDFLLPAYSFRSLPQMHHKDRSVAYTTLIANIAEQLRPNDVQAISKSENLPDTYPHRTPLEVLHVLEMRGLFSQREIQPLSDLLRNINRNDLVHEHVEPYRVSLANAVAVYAVVQ